MDESDKGQLYVFELNMTMEVQLWAQRATAIMKQSSESYYVLACTSFKMPKYAIKATLWVSGKVESVGLQIQLVRLVIDRSMILQSSLTSFTETPLHISALAGHLEFGEALLSEKSASRLDSLNRSPLHLAFAEGHIEIVKALLRADIDVCLVPDEEGRIPLHLAVTRGKVEVIQELINARPNSILEKLNGNTALHLAVKYNQLKALRQLVTQLNEDELFDFIDHLGNTILHSAVTTEAIRGKRNRKWSTIDYCQKP